MFRTHVTELVRGDDVYVENHWGEFEIRRVVAADKWRLTVVGQRFMKKSGWETLYWPTRKELTSGKRNRHRVHFGDGLLFTPERVQRYMQSQLDDAVRTELIYKALRTSPVLWRHLSIEQLQSINQWLNHT